MKFPGYLLGIMVLLDASALQAQIMPKFDRLGEVKITSKRSDFDRSCGVIMFEGNATARSDGYFMRADRMYAFLSGTNSLERIVAIGAVAITNNNRHGSCAMATYRRTAGEVEMYADKHSPAVLSEKDSSSVSGRSIKFWLDKEQFEVVKSEITIQNANKGVINQ